MEGLGLGEAISAAPSEVFTASKSGGGDIVSSNTDVAIGVGAFVGVLGIVKTSSTGGGGGGGLNSLEAGETELSLNGEETSVTVGSGGCRLYVSGCKSFNSEVDASL